MGARRTMTTLAAAIATTSIVAPAAQAAVDVTRAGDGVVWVRGGDAAEQVTVDRADDGRLRIVDASGAATSADASCTADPAAGAVLCDASTTFVRAVLAGGTDTLDATEADLAALVFNGGAGGDTVAPTGARFARVWDPTTTDTVDLSALDGGVRARWNRTHRRVMLTCPDCSPRRTVLLSGRPGTVVTTSSGDDVDLRAWRVPGSTRWLLGEGTDRFVGSTRRRSVVDGGADFDDLVSYAPRDVLRGGDGSDKLADFGGRGDVLLGGDGIDAFSSMDGQRDTLDGQGDTDFCLAPRGHSPSGCDSGPVRSMESATFMPFNTQPWVFRTLGIG